MVKAFKNLRYPTAADGRSSENLRRTATEAGGKSFMETADVATTRAHTRTLARLLWSAQVEGLMLPPIATNSYAAALAQVRAAVQSSCQSRGIAFCNDNWSRLLAEVEQSARNETHAIAWRDSTWIPRIRSVSQPHDSLWSWLGTMDAATEQAQLAWETCASFDGHLTHPCAKVKFGLTLAELETISAEFSPSVPLVVAAIAADASKSHVTDECGAASTGAYFASRFPTTHTAWRRWLEARVDTPDAYVPLPIHPANMKHVRDDFTELIISRDLLLPAPEDVPTAATISGAPLMSCRTLLPQQCVPERAANGEDTGGVAAGTAPSERAPPYIKLPVPVQMTSLQRYLSPVEANGGPVISDMLLTVIARDPLIAASLLMLPEESTCHVDAPNVSYERSRYLSALYRDNLAERIRRAPTYGGPAPALPPGTRCMPLAALLSVDPISGRPVLSDVLRAAASACEEPVTSGESKRPRSAATTADHGAENAAPAFAHPHAVGAADAAASWYASYCDVALGAALRLWLCYGVTLELHGQNTLLLLGPDGALSRLVCREVAGGAYCYEPLLVANGFDLRPRLHPRQDAVFDEEDLPLSILMHALYCQHLLPLADAVSSLVEGVRHAQLLDTLRATTRATLQACEATHEMKLIEGDTHRQAFRRILGLTEHALLEKPTVRAKSLLHMRALGTKSEMFTEARNPLLPSGGTREDGESRGDGDLQGSAMPIGRLADFPLSWRPLHEVAGCAHLDEQRLVGD